ncbi:MAG TPA: hypothetical protein VGS19_10800 [Streptosporangiaceae bacterium]|nr:hypothetical protein [Streptosporangiaceae bacterium]
MTATSAPAAARPRPATRRRPGLATARLLCLELRHNAMMWTLPVAIALFWFITYRKAVAMPPLWELRATSLQPGALVDFALPVVGASAWMGAREGRRHTTDLVTTTAQQRWARLLVTWAATTCWAVMGYLACVAVLYGVTAQQATWGGPLWWPVAVAGAGLAALSALGFAAGELIPSRFTAPLAAVASFFVLALSTQPIDGGQSYWQVSPIVTGPWDLAHNPGAATFYPYLPDLSIAQVVFLGGLTVAVLGAVALRGATGGRRLRWPAASITAAVITAAGLVVSGTAVVLTGTGRMDAHGMIVIPALHDAANDRPLRYTPACSRTAIPVCLNPAYASYLPVTVGALAPLITEVAGLPGAPVRISQAAATYRQEQGNSVAISLTGPSLSGRPPVFHFLLPDQFAGSPMTAGQTAAAVRSGAGVGIVASFIGGGTRLSQAQEVVMAALMTAARIPVESLGPQILATGNSQPGQGRFVRCVASAVSRAAAANCRPPQARPMFAVGSPATKALQRFSALSAAARRGWLAGHLAALRAGRITLAQLP